ncbi:MAG: threonine/serine dehydratase [Alphaproteobacteria bacterium]|nr:threonine/serine dehydratase [Alphaproteobacteria bacterium]
MHPQAEGEIKLPEAVRADANEDRWIYPPTVDDVRDAEAALNGIAVETPLLENRAVNKKLSGRVLIKAEMAQRTGSFKFRGAYNRIRQLTKSQRDRGVVAYFSGNHAQAVASAARMMGTSALIVMPSDAPSNKMDRTRELGAEVVTYDRTKEKREEVAERIGGKRNLVMVPPNEDARVLAGAGTVALELIRQAKARQAVLDTVLVPCGGGGLTAATALVFEALSPKTKIFAVEPEQFDDTRRSFEAGERLANPKGRKTICDAIMTDIPGELTFSINRERLSGVLTVSDDDVRSAMNVGFDRYKTVIEPGAAVGLAAVLQNKIDIGGNTVAVIATGGNVDARNFCAAINADLKEPPCLETYFGEDSANR